MKVLNRDNLTEVLDKYAYPEHFYHYDIRSGHFYEDPFVYESAHEGATVGALRMEHDIISDEFTLSNIDVRGAYIQFENGSTISIITKTPDFGEFSHTQELQNFLDNLV